MTSNITFANQIASRWRVNSWLLDITLVAAGSLLLALSAQVAVPVVFSPVPITGQTFSVLLLGALYGSRRGAATVAAYLIEGLPDCRFSPKEPVVSLY